MRRFNVLVYEEVMDTGGNYTSTRHNLVLGQFDNLVVQAVVDKVDPSDVAGSLAVFVQHSGDGRSWTEKPSSLLVAPVTPGVTTSLAATDSSPSLALVRLRVLLSVTGRARARIYVTARDAGG